MSETTQVNKGAQYEIGTVGPNTPLKIDIQNQEILDLSIKMLKLRPVTNPVSFERKGIPTADGLFSEFIFGSSIEERKRQWAYINLNTKIIHPFIFEILCKLQQNIEKCCAGEGCWKVTDEGDLIKLKDNEPGANTANSGMDWFIANLPKIKFKRNKSIERNERIDMLETLKCPEDYVIHEWLVMPVFYRDVESKDGTGMPKIPPINNEYINLIRYAKSLGSRAISIPGIVDMGNAAKVNIQHTTMNIHKYFRQIIEKSDGYFKQYVVGKNPDFGYRSVISCPVLDQYDTPEEVPIDVNHIGIPLSNICVTLYPFIEKWVFDFFTEMFETTGNKIPVLTAKNEVIYVELDNPMADYTVDKIKNRIDKYIDNYESRFEPVTVRYTDGGGSKVDPVAFGGRPYDPRKRESTPSTPIINRVFTWTDVLYIAAVECSLDKHEWTTRYPLISYLGIFPCKVHVMSTYKTTPIKLRVNGFEREYPYYPVVTPDAPSDVIQTAFNDTVNMDNSFLDAIGGDYDGDTVSHRAVFSVEANDETEDIMRSKKHYLDCQGKLTRTLGNEAILCLFSWTRFDKNATMCKNEAIAGNILSARFEDVGIRKLTEWFGTTYDPKTKKVSEPKCKNTDIIFLQSGMFNLKEKTKTTLGILAFNKVCIEPYIKKIIPGGYWNIPLNKGGYSQLFGIIATELKYDRITTEELWPFLKAIQFYAYKATTIFSSSMTEASIIPDKKIIAEREKFFKENPNPTLDEIANLEDKLTAMLKEKIDNDTSSTLFGSGAKAKVDDQLKNINTMIGPVYNPATGQYDIIKSSYMDGFAKEDIPKAGNMVVSGVYPKSCGSADAGYVTKQFYAGFGGISVDVPNSDCHTKSYLLLTYTEENWKSLEGQNVMVGDDKYETVTDKNYKKFLNHPIKVRSAMCCISKPTCSVCAGARPYEIGMENIGINFAAVPNTFVNAGMKKFHSSRVRLSSANIDTLFI